MDERGRRWAGNQFTKRELEILRLITDGLSNEAVADRLFISPGTVKWHLKQIYGKLQVGSRTQAIAATRNLGLLDEKPGQIDRLPSDHNLPLQSTPFIGRTTELGAIATWLANPDCRVLTLVGPGGIGKTRLALETAQTQLAHFRDGVFFVALAPLSDPNQIPTVIAEAAHVPLAPWETSKNQLLNYLRGKQILLLLDNFEHLLPGADLIPEILQAGSGIKLLVTARERIHLQSEVVFRLDGFPFSDWPTPEEAVESSAGMLFLQSARRVRPSFELSQATLGHLSAICRLVNGMPLGILLAASWLDMLSIAEIAQEIVRGFEFLEGELRDLPERQRSLRAVFMHSWRLLGEVERSAMRCFSIFRGGFTREAAEQVGDVSLRTLTSLVNKSLLSRDPQERFELHELLRQFSERELAQMPPERELVEARHAGYYADFMAKQWKPLRSARAKETADLIELEIDNVRAAWNFMLAQAQLPLIAMTARALWFFLEVRARYDDAVDLFERAVETLRLLPASAARDITLGDVLQVLGWFYWLKSRIDEGKLRAEECLTLLQGHNAGEIAVHAHFVLCACELIRAEYQAMKNHAQRGCDLAQRIADPWYSANTAFLLGVALFHLEDYEAAYQAGKEGLHYAEASADPWIEGLCCGEVLGRSALMLGAFEEAKSYCLRSIRSFGRGNHIRWQSQMHRYLCEVYALTGEYEAATRAYQLALGYFLKLGDRFMLTGTLRSIAVLFEAQGEYARAVELLALLIVHPAAVMSDKQQAQLALTRVRPNMSTEDFSTAYEIGKSLDLETLMVALLDG